MLVAIYARVSTQRQEDEETIETQKMAVKDFIIKNGHQIIKEYQDEGWSGMILARPSLDELRIDARKKIWEAVVIYDPDRLSRKYSYQELVTDELNELGVQVLYVTTPPPKDDGDRLLYGVKGLFAEYERARIAERFRLGKLRKAREGNVVTSQAPYGYDYMLGQGLVKGYYKINKREASVVKMIFHWIANEGLTIRIVVKKLFEMGIIPRKSIRKVWNSSTLTTLLRNETYIGIAHFNRSYAIIPENPLKNEKYKRVKKTSRRFRPEAEWIEIKVPAIIDKKLFEKARKQLKINYELCSRNRRNEYLLAKMIYCTCGKRRAGEGPQRGKHLYYRCTDRVYSYPLPKNCNEMGINARIADKLVWQKISQLMTEPKLLKEQIKRWVSSQEQNPQKTLESEEVLKEELKELDKKELRYIKAFGAKVLSLKQLDESTSEIRLRKSVIEKQIGEIEIQKTNTNYNIPDTNLIDDYCKQVTPKLEGLSFEAKRAILTKVIDKVVGNQKELAVYGYLTLEDYKYNQDVKFETSSRNSRFAKCGEVDIV